MRYIKLRTSTCPTLYIKLYCHFLQTKRSCNNIPVHFLPICFKYINVSKVQFLNCMDRKKKTAQIQIFEFLLLLHVLGIKSKFSVPEKLQILLKLFTNEQFLHRSLTQTIELGAGYCLNQKWYKTGMQNVSFSKINKRFKIMYTV